jgi:hypothetical protein
VLRLYNKVGGCIKENNFYIWSFSSCLIKFGERRQRRGGF